MSNGNCKKGIGKCESYTNTTCQLCENDVITSNGNCNINVEKCLYSENTPLYSTCFVCESGYESLEIECVPSEYCAAHRNGQCVETVYPNHFVDLSGQVQECIGSTACRIVDATIINFQCYKIMEI